MGWGGVGGRGVASWWPRGSVVPLPTSRPLCASSGDTRIPTHPQRPLLGVRPHCPVPCWVQALPARGQCRERPPAKTGLMALCFQMRKLRLGPSRGAFLVPGVAPKPHAPCRAGPWAAAGHGDEQTQEDQRKDRGPECRQALAPAMPGLAGLFPSVLFFSAEEGGGPAWRQAPALRRWPGVLQSDPCLEDILIPSRGTGDTLSPHGLQSRPTCGWKVLGQPLLTWGLAGSGLGWA